MAPLVSILIPCYNGAPFIKACLQSCFQQSYSDLEILLIDNNSTDDSIIIAEKEAHRAKKRITVVQCSKQGLKHARSHGNRIAKGEYVQFLDADDQLGPDKIAFQVAALEKQSQYTLAYSDWFWCFHYPDGKRLDVRFQSTQIDDYLAQLLINNWRPPHTYLMRRDVVDRVDPIYSLDSGNTSSEDREFFTLAALLGYKFLHVPETYVYYNNWSTQQITKKVNYLERAAGGSNLYH